MKSADDTDQGNCKHESILMRSAKISLLPRMDQLAFRIQQVRIMGSTAIQVNQRRDFGVDPRIRIGGNGGELLLRSSPERAFTIKHAMIERD